MEDIQASDLDLWTSVWLRAEGFRGHTLAPLIAEGRAIGAMVIDTYQPRLMDQDEVRFLRLMVNLVAIAIEKARLHQEEIKQQRSEQELAIAKQIQLTFLPKVLPLVPGWEFAAYYQAARMVGGDFYDFFELPGELGQLGVVIADVTDKGVPAALFIKFNPSQ